LLESLARKLPPGAAELPLLPSSAFAGLLDNL
jgi:hypothetical protein